jgi:branched-chain amino acid aminotransferase
MDEIIEAQRRGLLKEAIGTGTAAVISSIGELFYRGETLRVGDGQRGPLATRLYETITAIQYGEAADPFGWTTVL